MFRRRNRDVFVELMVVGPDTGGSVSPPRRTGIQGDVNSGIVDQEGDSVPVLQSFQPPDDVLLEGFLQVNVFKVVRSSTSSCSSFRSQYTVEEKPASKENITSMQ